VKLGREVIQMHKSQIQELQDAVKNHRQPICVECHRPLDVVVQPENTITVWEWDGKQHRFVKRGPYQTVSNAPRHAQCGALDWGLGMPTKPARAVGLGVNSEQKPAESVHDWLPLKQYKAGRRKPRKHKKRK
jgi:hypothetical protein